MELFSLKSSDGVLDLACAIERPSGEVRGVVQLVHGMCEHKERYFKTMEWLASEGYAVIVHDHRGHGGSVLSKEDLGFFYDGGWKAMVEDVKVVGDHLRAEYPGVGFCLFGHSMGSLVVRSYAKRYDDTLDSLIVCGCPSDNPAKGIGRLLAKAFGAVKGDHYRPMLMQAMSFGSFNKPFDGEKSPRTGRTYHSAWVCSNTEILDAYHGDPLCMFVFTANGWENLMALMQDCYGSKGWTVKNPGLKTMFISGGDDPCRVSDKAWNQAVDFFASRGYSNVSRKLYPGMRHEILNETNADLVREDILKLLGN